MTNNETLVQRPSLGTSVCPDNSIHVHEPEFSWKIEDLLTVYRYIPPFMRPEI